MALTTNKNILVAIMTVIAAAGISTSSVLASTQDDIQSCREALTEKGEIDMDAYRLSFKKKKGNSNRTLTLEALPNSEGDKYLVTCTLSKSTVTEVSLEAI